jgi:hypothetical protein
MFAILTGLPLSSWNNRDSLLLQRLRSNRQWMQPANVRKRERDLFIAAVIAAVLLAGALDAQASTSYSIDLYNSTDNPVELVSPKTGHLLATIPAGRSLLFKYSEGVHLRGSDGRMLNYERVDPPKEFVRATFLATVFKAQLNPDLRIWLVPPAASHPTLQLPQQPPGFPLTPR